MFNDLLSKIRHCVLNTSANSYLYEKYDLIEYYFADLTYIDIGEYSLFLTLL